MIFVCLSSLGLLDFFFNIFTRLKVPIRIHDDEDPGKEGTRCHDRKGCVSQKPHFPESRLAEPSNRGLISKLISGASILGSDVVNGPLFLQFITITLSTKCAGLHPSNSFSL